jgi:hypothetical protein
MRVIGSSCLVIAAALSGSLLAQQHARYPAGRGLAPGGDARNIGLPPVQPIPMLGMPAPRARSSRLAPPFPHAPLHGLPFFPGVPLLFDGQVPAYTPAANTHIVIVQPTTVVSQQAPPVDPRPEPIRSMLLEPRQPAPPASLTPEPPAPFVLVDRRGAEHLAMAVVALGDRVYYVDPANRHRRILLTDVDPEKTRQRNRDRNLVLTLPAP